MLKLYNSLSKRKEEFTPIASGRVGMYVCGMTVYDKCHVGHARMLLTFDMVYRWLRARGFAVTYVRNITDIDDKIIARAAQNREPIEALTERTIADMHRDLKLLNTLPPTHEPRATQYVPGMLALIEKLMARGLAYLGANGDVYYSVRDFPGYGKLSGKSLDDLRAGERVAVAEQKRDPLDFVLWKASKPGEPKWSSPWGDGRPGWHIECSAMSESLLGAHFDIHGGGQDLQFPHHENEIAQSEGAHGHTFVNYWLHNGFVRVNDEKMSKSLGNFFTIEDVLKVYDPEVVRFFILRAHYRSPLNYADQQLDEAKQALTTLYTSLRGIELAADEAIDWSKAHAARFKDAMDDDFNTPEAMAVLFELANEVNRTRDRTAARQLKALAGVLGLLQRAPEEFLQAKAGGAGALDAAWVEAQIAARKAARAAKNFAESDRIRDELLAKGVVLEDTAKGTIWRMR